MRQQPVGRPNDALSHRSHVVLQSDRREMATNPVRIRGRTETQRNRKIEGKPHTDGHRFAVQEDIAKGRLRLQRMAERMAKVQERPPVGLALVLGHDRRFRLTTRPDSGPAGRQVTLATNEGRPGHWSRHTGEQEFTAAALIEAGVEIVTNRGLKGFDETEARLACVFTGRTITAPAKSLLTVTAPRAGSETRRTRRPICRASNRFSVDLP